MTTVIKTTSLQLHRDAQFSDDAARRTRMALALLAERHDALDELPMLIDMLGVGK